MKFVFFHGSFVGPEYIWWPYLKKELEKLGQTVIAPQFPVDFWKDAQHLNDLTQLTKQTLTSWTETYIELKKQFKSNDKLCFVGHSLGPLFILEMLEEFPIQLDSAIFVAPFFSKLNKSPRIDHVNSTFYREKFDFNKLTTLIPKSYVLYSDDDPYVDIHLSIKFAKNMHSETIPIHNVSHMDSSIQIIRFPLLLELCKTRIAGSLYLKELQIL